MYVGELSRRITKKYIRYWLNFAKNMAQCKASPTRNDETISEKSEMLLYEIKIV